jgi:hypothetical protein
MDMWCPHTRSGNTLNNQRYVFLLFTALTISCLMMVWCRAICRMPNKGPYKGTLKAPRRFPRPAMRKL